MSAISGDGSLDTSTGIVTITSTNGTPFAASATLDTTNATNIGSGTLDGARLPNTVNQCPSDIDTWNGVLDKTISSTVGFVYTTGSTQIAAPRTLTLPIVAGHGISTCPLVFMDLARIVNSTGTVVPTRQSTDTIDGNTTGTTMACAGQTSAWTAPVAASWGTVAPPTLCSDTVVTGQYLTVINDNGTVGRAQVNFNQLAGTATGAQLPAATTSTQGAALLHNVPFSMGWNSATNPDGNFVAVVTQASRITAIKGRIGPAVGATAAITVKKAASAVDCAASGTPLHTGTFDANGTANTVQTLTLVGGATDDLAVNDTVCFSTANGAAFLAGVGKGVISIDWAPL
jgi:hypothetical protein